MTALAHKLGLAPTYTFHDILSLTDPTLLPLPGPCHALLFIFPCTPTHEAHFAAADAARKAALPAVELIPPQNPTVLHYYQTIRHACGLHGLLHCVANLALRRPDVVAQGSLLQRFLRETTPLRKDERARWIYESAELEALHAESAQLGDSVAPLAEEYDDGNGFVAFVEGGDGRLWELEGCACGPIDLGDVGEGGLLGASVMERGPLAYVGRELERGEGADLGFSCIALCEEV